MAGSPYTVGYQGAPYSNSHRAALTGFDYILGDDPILVPMVTSEAVAESLRDGSIDFGVVALENSIGSTVAETSEILDTGDFEIVSESGLPIHHCLFIHPDIEVGDIDTIASHIQALIQTSETRSYLYPWCDEMEIEDTAIGASWLIDGVLPITTGVICPKEAGQANWLTMVAENLEDAYSVTTFGLIRLASGGDLE